MGRAFRSGLKSGSERRNAEAPSAQSADRWDYDETVTQAPAENSCWLFIRVHGANTSNVLAGATPKSSASRTSSDFVVGLMRTAVALRRQEEDRKQREADEQKRVLERVAAPERHPRREEAGAVQQRG